MSKKTCESCNHKSEYVQTYDATFADLDLCNNCAENLGYRPLATEKNIEQYFSCEHCFKSLSTVHTYRNSITGHPVRLCDDCSNPMWENGEIMQDKDPKTLLDATNTWLEKQGWTPPPADREPLLLIAMLVIGIIGGWLLNSVITAIQAAI